MVFTSVNYTIYLILIFHYGLSLFPPYNLVVNYEEFGLVGYLKHNNRFFQRQINRPFFEVIRMKF